MSAPVVTTRKPSKWRRRAVIAAVSVPAGVLALRTGPGYRAAQAIRRGLFRSLYTVAQNAQKAADRRTMQAVFYVSSALRRKIARGVDRIVAYMTGVTNIPAALLRRERIIAAMRAEHPSPELDAAAQRINKLIMSYPSVPVGLIDRLDQKMRAGLMWIARKLKANLIGVYPSRTRAKAEEEAMRALLKKRAIDRMWEVARKGGIGRADGVELKRIGPDVYRRRALS